MNNENNTLTKNAFFNVLYRVLNMLFPLITTTYIARILLPDGVGRVTKAINVVQYFVVIAGLGIPNYGVREIAKRRKNQEEINKLFTELFLLNVFSTTLCLLSYILMIGKYEYFHNEYILHLIVGLLILFNYINVDWFYQGNEQYRFIAIRNTIVKLLSILFLVFFVRSKADYKIYAIIYCFALGGNHILNIICLHNKISFVFHGIDIKKHMRPVLFLLASTISIELYTLVDVTMLGYYSTSSVVGYYNNASKFARMVNSLIASIGTVLLPRLSYYLSQKDYNNYSKAVSKAKDILFFFAFPAVAGVFTLSEDIIVLLFGEPFRPAGLTLRIMSFIIIAVVFNNLYGTQILLSLGKEGKLLISVAIGAVINITLNTILIPIYKHNGAALASIASEGAVWLATWYFAKKEIALKPNVKNTLTIVTATLLMVPVLLLLHSFNYLLILKIISSVLAGTFIYVSVLCILKNDTVIFILSKIKRKEDSKC